MKKTLLYTVDSREENSGKKAEYLAAKLFHGEVFAGQNRNGLDLKLENGKTYEVKSRLIDGSAGFDIPDLITRDFQSMVTQYAVKSDGLILIEKYNQKTAKALGQPYNIKVTIMDRREAIKFYTSHCYIDRQYAYRVRIATAGRSHLRDLQLEELGYYNF